MLIAAGLQVGVVSWGRGCGSYPGVYGRISLAHSWISSVLDGWDSKLRPVDCVDFSNFVGP
eukprot:scaffold260696_cov39-Prasinocladus_malaysianus.AAC.1